MDLCRNSRSGTIFVVLASIEKSPQSFGYMFVISIFGIVCFAFDTLCDVAGSSKVARCLLFRDTTIFVFRAALCMLTRKLVVPLWISFRSSLSGAIFSVGKGPTFFLSTNSQRPECLLAISFPVAFVP